MNYLLYVKIDIHETYFIKTLQNIIENKLIKEINVYNLSKENNNELYIYNFIYKNHDKHNNIDTNTNVDTDVDTNVDTDVDTNVDTYIKNILIIIENYAKNYFPEFNNKWKINYNLIKQ